MIAKFSYPLAHFGERPAGAIIDTLVIHSMHAPDGPNPVDPRECIELLNSLSLSAHYLLDQEGALWSLVAEEKRAWHAGMSKMPFADDAREGVNDFSIGVELVNIAGEPFTEAQYSNLAAFIVDLRSRRPLRNIVSHSAISPGRKVDPGPLFSSKKLQGIVQSIAAEKFPPNAGSTLRFFIDFEPEKAQN